jgi:hypothetical protein
MDYVKETLSAIIHKETEDSVHMTNSELLEKSWCTYIVKRSSTNDASLLKHSVCAVLTHMEFHFDHAQSQKKAASRL